LCEELAKLTDRVAHVPNVTFDRQNFDLLRIHSDSEPCTFVMASSDTVRTDFMIAALRAFLQKYPQHKLLVIGAIAATLQDTGLKFAYVSQCSPKEFSKVLLSVHNGIGLIPLDASLFSSCKSAIKFFHYSMTGVVSIASNVPPYAMEIEKDRSGVLVDNTPEDWLTAMEKVCSSASLRRRLLAGAVYHCNRRASPEQSFAAWKKAFYGLPKPDKDTFLNP
jgi:glycosyltransferase involved in cell wall biosynthesis